MSRKTVTFGQLVNYMNSHSAGPDYDIHHNSYPMDSDSLIQDFEANSEFSPKRKNGIYLYHEILSITTTPELSREIQKDKLREIAEEYIQRRAAKNIVFAALHDDATHNLHYHFIISSNELGKAKKTRLSKHQFDRFKKDFEAWAITKYPELNQEVTINKDRELHITNKGAELKRRTGKTPQKDAVKERLSTLFEISRSKQELFAFLDAERLELYVRGKTIGFKDIQSGRKYRVKTLGLETEFRAMSDRLELEAKTPVVDYEQAKGRKERVRSVEPEKTGPQKPAEHRSTQKEYDVSNSKPKDTTEPEKAPEDTDSKSPYSTTAREWIYGDFSERDARARKAKFQAQAEKDRKVKDRADQNAAENLVETGKEWLFGDFDNREARSRNRKSEERLAAWREERDKAAEEKKNIKAREERRDELKRIRDQDGPEKTNDKDLNPER